MPAMRLGFAMSVCLAACGDLVDEHYEGEPLAVLKGRLLAADNAPAMDREVSLALMWERSDFHDPWVRYDPALLYPLLAETTCTTTVLEGQENCDGTPYRLVEECTTVDLALARRTEEVDYEPIFPISFSVPVFHLPPAEALYDLSQQGGQGSFAMGYLMAYDDIDGDGEFKFGSPVLAPEPVLAAAVFQDYQPPPNTPRESFFIVFLDGTINLDNVLPSASYRDTIASVPQGFSIWWRQEYVDDPQYPSQITREVLPISAQIDMTVRPEVDKFGDGCETRVRREIRFDDGTAYGDRLWCDELGTTAQWYTWTFSHEEWVDTCTYESTLRQACIGDLAQPPADWPCVF